MMTSMNPDDYVISRKRKKYRFALFANSPLCYEVDEWGGEITPTVLELGAGTGLFSVNLASTQPDEQVLAVDVKADRLQTGAIKAADENLQNVHFLRSRADQLADLLPKQSLSSLWVTFPDPFPKERMAKHRLTHPQYLALYAQLLNDDGALHFKTDAKPLFEWSLERLIEQGWRIVELSFDLHESELSDNYKVMTTYELRYTSQQLPIHFVKALPPLS